MRLLSAALQVLKILENVSYGQLFEASSSVTRLLSAVVHVVKVCVNVSFGRFFRCLTLCHGSGQSVGKCKLWTVFPIVPVEPRGYFLRHCRC